MADNQQAKQPQQPKAPPIPENAPDTAKVPVPVPNAPSDVLVKPDGSTTIEHPRPTE